MGYRNFNQTLPYAEFTPPDEDMRKLREFGIDTEGKSRVRRGDLVVPREVHERIKATFLALQLPRSDGNDFLVACEEIKLIVSRRIGDSTNLGFVFGGRLADGSCLSFPTSVSNVRHRNDFKVVNEDYVEPFQSDEAESERTRERVNEVSGLLARSLIAKIKRGRLKVDIGNAVKKMNKTKIFWSDVMCGSVAIPIKNLEEKFHFGVVKDTVGIESLSEENIGDRFLTCLGEVVGYEQLKCLASRILFQADVSTAIIDKLNEYLAHSQPEIPDSEPGNGSLVVRVNDVIFDKDGLKWSVLVCDPDMAKIVFSEEDRGTLKL